MPVRNFKVALVNCNMGFNVSYIYLQLLTIDPVSVIFQMSNPADKSSLKLLLCLLEYT